MRVKLKKEKRNGENINRLRFVTAVIFLLSGCLLLRLFNIQVLNRDLYAAMANSQHNIYSKLEPKRGKIFLQDTENGEKKFYPAATNKDYALVYAVPKDIEDPQGTAEAFYEIFDKENVEKEVDLFMSRDDYFKNVFEEFNPLLSKNQEMKESEKQEFYRIKRELEIELRQERIIEAYAAKLGKKNDPYEPIKRKVDEDLLEKVIGLDIKGVSYIMEEFRYYPEAKVGSQLIGFVGYDGDIMKGRYGLEGFFDYELSGAAGSLRAERGAKGGAIIIKDREYNEPQNGSDLILTIDRSIQFSACKMLDQAVLKHGADGGTVIVMEPNTGAILAMCSAPNYDPNNYHDVKDINVYNNPAIFEQYEPGSTFKSITMAIGIDQEKIGPHTAYEDKGYLMIEGWPKPISNSDFRTSGAHGRVDMVTVLGKSLNTGAIFVMKQAGEKVFADYVVNFGFGEKTGIELETEGLSNINNLKRARIRPIEAATASFGQGITVTSLQMISAYSAIVNGGILMKPYVVAEIVSPDGKRQITQPKQIRRVLSEKAALLTSGMMVNVVEGGHAVLAGVDGYYVGGKTGTAQVADSVKGGYSDTKTIHSFIGFAPADDPRFVMLVKLDHPKDVRYGASSAAPLFRQIAEFVLNHYKIKKER